MVARANWFAGGEKPAEPQKPADPFSEARPTPRHRQPSSRRGSTYWRADEFTLDTPLDVLRERYKELLAREANGFDAGIACALKDDPEMSCVFCPVHERGKDTRLSALCRLGREQERILALIVTKRIRGEGEPDGQ